MSFAVRSMQTALRKGSAVPKAAKVFNRSITSHTNTTNASRQSTANEASNKAAYATVAPGISPSPFEPAMKFRVPFDEGPTVPTLDNIVHDIESIPEAVSKERGYQIIGEVKAPQDKLMKILALGDMRIWQ